MNENYAAKFFGLFTLIFCFLPQMLCGGFQETKSDFEAEVQEGLQARDQNMINIAKQAQEMLNAYSVQDPDLGVLKEHFGSIADQYASSNFFSTIRDLGRKMRYIRFGLHYEKLMEKYKSQLESVATVEVPA